MGKPWQQLPRMYAPGEARPPGTGGVPLAPGPLPVAPWGGDWVPPDYQTQQWGSSDELSISDGATVPDKLSATLLNVDFPLPLIVVVTMTIILISPAPTSWLNVTRFIVEGGVGKGGGAPQDFVVNAIGAPNVPPLPRYFAQVRTTGPMAAKSLRVSAEVFAPQLGQTPGARWSVSAAVAVQGT